MITTGVILGMLLAGLLFAAVIATIFMWIGAKIVGVEKPTFGRAVIAAVGSSFVSWVLAAVSSRIPPIGAIPGFIIGLLASVMVIKAAFETDTGKAFGVWIFNITAQIAAVAIVFALFAGAVALVLGAA